MDGSHGARARTVVVVGGGAAGLLTALHLARSGLASPARVVIVDPGPPGAAGTAYTTSCDAHLLNVRAAKMSARADDPDHFVAWLRGEGYEARACDFVPRRLFGAYLNATLADAVRTDPDVVQRRRASVVGISDGERPTVHTSDGAAIAADQVVLALGNSRPRPLGAPCDRVVDNVWEPGWLDAVGAPDDIVIVGSGLTAVDMILSLHAQGHHGKITLVSRHGRLPAAHVADDHGSALPTGALDVSRCRSTRAVIAEVRSAVRRVEAEGGDWRSVVDGLRPMTTATWQMLDDGERARFLRHARAQWEHHRHRMAPAAARVVESLVACGRVGVVAGSVVHAQGSATDSGAFVEAVHPDGSGSVRRATHHGDWVLNCTGPSHALDRRDDPLIAQLLRDGMVRCGPLGLGVDVDAQGMARDATGRAGRVIAVVGALRVGNEWESTAIPEIRTQACATAARIAAVLRPRVVASGARLSPQTQ